jgi:hypothetical protein
MNIKDVVDLYKLIYGDFLTQLFASKLSYSELYICSTNLLLSKLLVPVKHDFIKSIIYDLITDNFVRRSFWTGKYELTYCGRQKALKDVMIKSKD